SRRRAAEPRNELAASHAMTSSATSIGGRLRPTGLAVLRLSANWKRVGRPVKTPSNINSPDEQANPVPISQKGAVVRNPSLVVARASIGDGRLVVALPRRWVVASKTSGGL